MTPAEMDARSVQYTTIQFAGERDQVDDAIRITEAYARRLAKRAGLAVSTHSEEVEGPHLPPLSEMRYMTPEERAEFNAMTPKPSPLSKPLREFKP